MPATPLLLVPASNQFLNGDFAADTSGWSTFGTAVLTRTTTDSKFESASGQVTIASSTGDGEDGIYSNPTPGLSQPGVPALTGQTWTLDFWVKGPVSTQVGCYIYRDNFADFFAFVITTLTGAWQEVRLTSTPLTSVTAVAGFAIDSRTAGAHAFKVDGVQFDGPRVLNLGSGTPTQIFPSSTTYPGISTIPGVVPLTLTAAGSTALTLTPA